MAGFENSTISHVDLQRNVTSQSTVQWDFVKTFTLSFNFLLGPPTHGIIIWLIFSGGRAVSDFLHLNLSACEVIISLTCALYWLEEMFPQLVGLLRFSVGLLVTARPLFQCLICVERYLAVIHPVTFMKYKPLRYRVMYSAAAWIISFGSCLFTQFTIVAHGKVYVSGQVSQFFFFLFVNLYCCQAVLRALKQTGPGVTGREREMDHKKRRAFQVILITTITVLILFLPTIIVGCIYVFSQLEISNFRSASFSCLIMAGFVQPVLYLYGKGMLRVCRKCSFQIPK